MYFGWFDGIPAHLNPLPPVEEGKKYVEAIGGEDEVMKKAREAYNQGGYQAESGPWRNFYLTGAMELTEGIAGKGKASSNRARMSQNLSPEMLFDLLAIQINGEKAADKDLITNIILTDTNEQATLILKNGA